MDLLSKSPEETFRIGEILAEGLAAGDVVALTGELGAGKTCLTQGIASGLGVPENYVVTSPTFTLINEYPGRRQSFIILMFIVCRDTPTLLKWDVKNICTDVALRWSNGLKRCWMPFRTTPFSSL